MPEASAMNSVSEQPRTTASNNNNNTNGSRPPSGGGQAAPQSPSSNSSSNSSTDGSDKAAGCSLLTILVVTCTVFVAVTSVVSFYVQYSFFVTEYHNQMTSRLNFYSQMAANQFTVMADSNSTALSQLLTTAQFDSFDGMCNMNPTSTSDYRWYVQMANALFYPTTTPAQDGSVIDFVFLATGNKLTVKVMDYKVTITTNIGGGMFMRMPYILNESLTPWFPLAAPEFVADPRTEGDLPTIIANPSNLPSPRLGTVRNGILPLHGVGTEATSSTPHFVVSYQIPTNQLLNWNAEFPSGDSFYFNDTGSVVTATSPMAENTTLFSVNRFLRHLAEKRNLEALVQSNLTSAIVKMESEEGGYTWGLVPLSLDTLTGRGWKLLIVDYTDFYLSSNEPIYSGVGVIVGVTVGACLLCFFLFRWWFMPLEELTDRVRDAGKGYSNEPMLFTPFSEIQQSQEAFLTVQHHLREIQSYVPQTLQQTKTGAPSSSTTTAGARGTGNRPSGANTVTNQPDEVAEPVADQAASSPMQVEPEDNTRTPCPMTAIHIKIHAYARWDAISPFLEIFTTVICRYQGVLDTVDYGTITATFNCHSQCPTHSVNAVKAANDIQARVRAYCSRNEGVAAPLYTIAIDTDNAMAVNVCFDDVKARVVIGDGFELVRKLTSLANDALRSTVVITDSVSQAVDVSQRVAIDAIQPAGAPCVRTVYELLELPFVWQDPVLGSKCEEKYQQAFQRLQQGDYTTACREFSEVVEATRGLEHCPLYRHGLRLLGVAEDHVNRQAQGPYVRVERCPWDVLPQERQIVLQQRMAPPPPHPAAAAANGNPNAQGRGMHPQQQQAAPQQQGNQGASRSRRAQ